MGIRIRNSGMLTTVQDLGRLGYQSQGLSVGGAMDTRSLRVANLLLDNDPNEAALEFTLLGPELEFTSNAVISLTGGNFRPTLNGRKAPMYQAFRVSAGAVLKLGAAVSGSRGYLAVAGGLDIPLVLGSRSTSLKAGLGGYHGRALAAGDEISFRDQKDFLMSLSRRKVPAEDFGRKEITLRVIMGPQEDSFTPEGILTFLGEEYEVTPESDRMGCRLAGPVIQTRTTSDILSDGIAPGAIQITSQGQPIVLLSDRQTTGGYAKIAAVISVDIPLIAQSMPGYRVRFAAVSVAEAQQLYRKELLQQRQWKESFAEAKSGAGSVLLENRKAARQADYAQKGRQNPAAGKRHPGGWQKKRQWKVKKQNGIRSQSKGKRRNIK